jgi:DNA-binding NtrC family response regulator
VERVEDYAWPGNVRELANCMRRAVALATASEIGLEALADLPCAIDSAKDDQIHDDGVNPDRVRAGVSLEEMERRLVEVTLEATGGNRSRAAGLLGVSLRTVRNKIRDYGLPSWSSYVHN